MVVHLAIITLLPLAALAYWPAPPAGNAGEGTPPRPTGTGAGVDSAVDTASVPATVPKDQTHPSPDSLRTTTLAHLHAEATRRFVAAPGNGVGRIGQISMSQLGQIGLGRIGTVQQQMPTLPKVSARDLTLATWSDLGALHKQSLTDFSANPSSALVAGKPDSSDLRLARNWEVKSLDLVGLLMHDRPVVYVSEKLEMSKLKEAPTRKLDSFEVAALAQLQAGKELFARNQGETVRLLGSVRARKLCLSCHDTSEGKLLGAFSYTLRLAK
jgi:hypothetical protein